MTKSLRFFTASCVALLGSALGSQQAIAQFAGAPNQFGATKDVGILGHQLEQLSSAGDAGRIRPFKSNQNTSLFDFDTVAMGAYLAANPGTATWTLNIQPADTIGLPDDMDILTVESLIDWTEGDGDGNGGALNWSSGTSSATYFYAQTVHNAGVLDTAASLEWIDPDSGPYTFTQRDPDYAAWGVPDTVGGGTSTTAANPTPAFTNSVPLLATDWSAAASAGEYASVVLDNAIIDALINDPNNRGLRTAKLVGGVGSNTRMWDRNQSGGLFTPFLEVTITAGQDGDFDGDLDVDGADFLKWQQDGLSAADLTLWENNYPTAAPLSGVNAVPEPSSVALLALSSALLLGRRNSRRS